MIGRAADLSPEARNAIEQWLAFQKSVRTVKAEFVQVRELRTLKSGLRSEGTVWIDRKGHRFRWQAGDEASPKSIAIQDGDDLTLMQPGRKRAERRSLSSTAQTRGGGAEAAFDFATGDLPDSIEELTKAFTITSARIEGAAWRFQMTPNDGRLREALSQVAFLVDPEKHHLRGFELTFRDGSVVKTTFTRQQFNLPLDAALFLPDLTGYQINEAS